MRINGRAWSVPSEVSSRPLGSNEALCEVQTSADEKNPQISFWPQFTEHRRDRAAREAAAGSCAVKMQQGDGVIVGKLPAGALAGFDLPATLCADLVLSPEEAARREARQKDPRYESCCIFRRESY